MGMVEGIGWREISGVWLESERSGWGWDTTPKSLKGCNLLWDI